MDGQVVESAGARFCRRIGACARTNPAESATKMTKRSQPPERFLRAPRSPRPGLSDRCVEGRAQRRKVFPRAAPLEFVHVLEQGNIRAKRRQVSEQHRQVAIARERLRESGG